MATASDAELVLRLYELRREEALRKARRFMVFEFQPKTLEKGMYQVFAKRFDPAASPA